MLCYLLMLATVGFAEELKVSSVGPQLEVYVDGFSVGSTPITLDVTSGSHTIRGKKTVAVSVSAGASDDNLMDSLYGAQAQEESIEVDMTMPPGGVGVLVFQWSRREADITTKIDPAIRAKIDSAMKRGDALRRQQQYMEAIFVYQEGVGLGSEEDDKRLQGGIAACEKAAGSKALSDVKAVAHKLCSEGDYAGSVVAYQSAIAMGGAESELRPLLNACKEKSDAAAAASSALDLALSKAESAEKRGDLGVSIGFYREALELGGEKVSLNAKLAKLKVDLDTAKKAGDDLCASSEFSKAFKAYERALSMGADPELIQGAVAECKEREEAAGNLEATREQADQLAKSGDLKAAVAVYRDVLTLGGASAEVQSIIDDLEGRMAALIVRIRGNRDDSDIQAYLEKGKLRLQPSSTADGEVTFEGVPADTAFTLVVGARGYSTVQEKVKPIPGKQSSKMTVEVTYLGMMQLELRDWEGPAKVAWEQKSGSTPLTAGSQEITALPGEVVITSAEGTLRWPFDGQADAIHNVDIPNLLPSLLRLNGLPEQSSVTINSAPNVENKGPVEIPASQKSKEDGPFNVYTSVDVPSLPTGSYEYTISHPVLGETNGATLVEAGQTTPVDFDWRDTEKGARIEEDYSNWQSARRSVPKEMWYGLGTGVASAGAFGLAGLNLLLAKQNQDLLLLEDGNYQDYVSARNISAAREAFETKDDLRVLRNQGLAFAALEVTVGTVSTVLTAWLFKKVKKKKGAVNQWDINTYAGTSKTQDLQLAEVQQ